MLCIIIHLRVAQQQCTCLTPRLSIIFVQTLFGLSLDSRLNSGVLTSNVFGLIFLLSASHLHRVCYKNSLDSKIFKSQLKCLISFLFFIQGNPIGQSGLGLMYMLGRGVEKVIKSIVKQQSCILIGQECVLYESTQHGCPLSVASFKIMVSIIYFIKEIHGVNSENVHFFC